MSAEQWEYLFVFTAGFVGTVVAYRWPQVTHSPRQLKTLRWACPLVTVSMGLVLLLSFVR